MATGGKFLNLIKTQAKTDNLANAYLVFGDFSLEELIEFLKIKQPDVFLNPEGPLNIEQVRGLIHWLYLKPHSSAFKLAILEDIEKMALPAANSLLKVLEEPPSSAILILRASEKEKILPTILSRCQIIREEKIVEEKPKNYLPAKKISRLSFKDRFDFVELIKEENIRIFIAFWEAEYRQELLTGKDVRGVLRAISQTRSLLSGNTSVKLLLENLLLKF